MTQIVIVGLGYVGLPLAVLLSHHFPLIGFEINEKKVQELRQNIDSMLEVSTEDLQNAKIEYTTNPEDIKKGDFIIVAVPTPILDSKLPDFKYLKSASQVVGENLKPGATVCYESTVYPGLTEELCVPLIEIYSGLKHGEGFKVAYSPERVNPGDKEHTIDKITKIVAASDAQSLELTSQVYSTICPIYKAASIKVAEAAKVVENTQRDLNIALVNELSLIFHKMDIDVMDVIEAAGTKWNFHKYKPGLVGGHCISVDPYYLTYRAEQFGYHPKVILSGREVNDSMPIHVAKMAMKGLNNANKVLKQSKILVMGLTFKENVPDIRNSKVKDLINELKEYGIKIIGVDPWLDKETVEKYFGIEYKKLEEINEPIDCIIFAQAHRQFLNIPLNELRMKMNANPILIDLKRVYNRKEAEMYGVKYETF
ncbi:MAG: nucleotide sugar dehydrogenase [archaeon]